MALHAAFEMIVNDYNINPMLRQARRSHPTEEIACRPQLTGSRVGADQVTTGSRHIPLWRPHEAPGRQCPDGTNPADQPPPTRASGVVSPHPMRILFVTSNRLGDAILSTGLLDHLIRTYPDCRITVVCGPVAAELFARMPNCERVIVLDKRRWSLHWPLLWTVAARRRWDKVVDIRGSGLAWMVRANRRAVMRSRPGHKLSQLAAVLGVDPPPLPVAWFSAEDAARVSALLPPELPPGRQAAP